MQNYTVTYLSCREAPMEVARKKTPVIELSVVVHGLMVAQMDEMQRNYENNLDPLVLHKIQSHPLFSIVCSYVESHLTFKGDFEFAWN